MESNIFDIQKPNRTSLIQDGFNDEIVFIYEGSKWKK
jgi:hypothetical protein